MAVIPGDGIGPEVTRVATAVLGAARRRFDLPIDLVERASRPWDLSSRPAFTFQFHYSATAVWADELEPVAGTPRDILRALEMLQVDDTVDGTGAA